MKYNKTVEEILLKINNNTVRKWKQDLPSYIFDDQIYAAKNIIKSFTAHRQWEYEEKSRNNHVILCARMQSWKTWTCNAVVNILEVTNLNHYFLIDKYFFISWMNERGLSRQTLKRINWRDDNDILTNEWQILWATDENTVFWDSEILEKSNWKYFIQKNSDLRKNSVELKNCLIFIDESHYGSWEENVLTTLLVNNWIDWKNTNALKERWIYVVSVSATPFDEVISDLAECKEVINLEVSKWYFWVSDFLERGLIFWARTDDFLIDKIDKKNRVLKLIEDAYWRMDEKRGVVFIRARDLKQETIVKDEFIRNNFEIKLLDSKKTSINYDIVNLTIDVIRWSPKPKPVLFLIKWAYRAWITINSEHKDFVYLIYDFSPNRAETSAQWLLWRMCWYRKDFKLINRTHFYVNLQHAEDYWDWELSEFSRDLTPAWKRWDWIWDNEKIVNYTEYKMWTRGIWNFEIILDDDEVKSIIEISQNERWKLKKRVFSQFLRESNLCLVDFDYIWETYTSWKSGYWPSVLKKWFNAFKLDNTLLWYRADSYFNEITWREDIDLNADFWKKIIHLVLDADYDFSLNKAYGSKKLLVYYGELYIQKKIRNPDWYIKEHKDTLNINK